MKKVIVLVISIIIGILVYKKSDEIIIPSDAIRIRIKANSNSIQDLYNKQKLKEEIKSDLYILVYKAKSSNEASDIISNNLKVIDNLISKKTNDYKVNYGNNYFPKKVYKGVIYPEGEYKSLVITLGSGLGDNWWCVLYPPLCMLEDNYDINDIEYRSFVADIVNN